MRIETKSKTEFLDYALNRKFTFEGQYNHEWDEELGDKIVQISEDTGMFLEYPKEVTFCWKEYSSIRKVRTMSLNRKRKKVLLQINLY